MVVDSQLCVGASTELLTSLNDGMGSNWQQHQRGHLRTAAPLFLRHFRRRRRC